MAIELVLRLLPKLECLLIKCPSFSYRSGKKGAKAGLATQVMDQALVAGAKTVKLAEIRK